VDIIQAITLGVVQGLTEFLPVSSTAHLTLVPWFFGWKDPGLTFDVALHVGTFLAVALYFRQDLTQMFFSWLKSLRHFDREDPYQKLSWLVIVGCIPAVIAGVVLDDYIAGVFRSPYVIAISLIAVGLLIAVAERLTQHTRTWKDMTLKDAILIGLAQACALIPGTSRSGSTITMGLFLGLERADAARYSFLLGFPVILGSAVFKLKDVAHDPTLSAMLPMMGVGVVVSAVSGYLCIRFLMRFLATNTMTVFVVYRVLLGLVILGMLLTGHAPTFAAD
jgi:undecaprenyl-diphosphatase